ncbi:TB2/DP1/HVA22-related protein like protein [Aduncisulcus paluster]|uniref:TB2/DP1/HVA22-related protein like protein n=1 Tax=Aduncisulcus paluster TaxID=2918883 RepID=A0ABQ5KJV0_9EUKA|nr:TB2/DP1/HVA22-related protein like protein [Aduncisulcus paluster]
MIEWMDTFTNVIALILPTYMSFKAIRTPGGDDDIQCLMFWIVYGFIRIAEFLINFVISTNSFVYQVSRLVFLIMLQIPKLNLAEKIYTKAIEPFLVKNEHHIDKAVQEGAKVAKKAEKHARKKFGKGKKE